MTFAADIHFDALRASGIKLTRSANSGQLTGGRWYPRDPIPDLYQPCAALVESILLSAA